MRISSFFVLAGYLAANAYVAARTSVFLHRNLPERVAKLISLLTAGVYSVFAMGMPLAHILPEGTAEKADSARVLRVLRHIHLSVFGLRHHRGAGAAFQAVSPNGKAHRAEAETPS